MISCAFKTLIKEEKISSNKKIQFLILTNFFNFVKKKSFFNLSQKIKYHTPFVNK